MRCCGTSCRWSGLLGALIGVITCCWVASGIQSPTPQSVQDEHTGTVVEDELETITLGAGCFWCTEAVFLQIRGVEKVVSGFSGGHVESPTYKQVMTGATGHAEVAQITFDPKVVSVDKILEVFFTCHDPTTLNRQGADVGTQYRSAIFYHNDAQRERAELYKRQLDSSGVFSDAIVTEITPFQAFYPAEDYHQNYFANNPNQGYCRAVVKPKVDKIKKAFAEWLKDK